MKPSRDLLKGKKILLGITGGIAAYKMPWLVRELRRRGADVYVVMTDAAREFVTPTTLSTVSGHEVVVSLFPSATEGTIDATTWHIQLALTADLMLVAPATANTIAKISHGFADNALTTLVLALRTPLAIAPTMDEDMWKNIVTQANLSRLREHGCFILPPDSGELASGLVGEGRLPDIPVIVEFIEKIMAKSHHDLANKKILVTAGPTYEPIDPVRFIGNRSSGKMGFAIARAAALRGAEVTLIAGPSTLATPSNVRRLDVETSAEMYDAVMKLQRSAQVIVMSAAVADYAPKKSSPQKMKKSDKPLTVELTQTKDILRTLGEQRNKKILVGFALETNDGLKNARTKLKEKNLDLIVLNNPTESGAGFGGDTNIVTLIGATGKPERLPLLSKFDVATAILDRVVHLLRS